MFSLHSPINPEKNSCDSLSFNLYCKIIVQLRDSAPHRSKAEQPYLPLLLSRIELLFQDVLQNILRTMVQNRHIGIYIDNIHTFFISHQIDPILMRYGWYLQDICMLHSLQALCIISIRDMESVHDIPQYMHIICVQYTSYFILTTIYHKIFDAWCLQNIRYIPPIAFCI